MTPDAMAHSADTAADTAASSPGVAAGVAGDAAAQAAAALLAREASGAMPPAADLAAFWEALEAHPQRFDLFQVLRWIDARGGSTQPLGRSSRPRYEPVRARQEPSLAFAPSTLADARAPQPDRPGEVSIYSFGLFGPNGPLPLHLTEFARERRYHHGDPTLTAFADLFHHRLILLFYRAWADAQPTVDLDRAANQFTRYVASLAGLGERTARQRDSIPDHAKYHVAPHLLRQTRNAEGLAQTLAQFFGVPLALEENRPQWIRLAPEDVMALGQGSIGQLGRDTTLGLAVYDVQYRFRLRLGPMTRAQYEAFLPGGRQARQLRDWVRLYVGREYAWDVCLVLACEQVPQARLGTAGPRLGLTSWMGHRRALGTDADDFVMDLELRDES